uniref:Uncharacterized protein n=1 Tax=Meloidogyne incognita TaxID=6306 RepID=A0A914LRC8_MELIC
MNPGPSGSQPGGMHSGESSGSRPAGGMYPGEGSKSQPGGMYPREGPSGSQPGGMHSGESSGSQQPVEPDAFTQISPLIEEFGNLKYLQFITNWTMHPAQPITNIREQYNNLSNVYIALLNQSVELNEQLKQHLNARIQNQAKNIFYIKFYQKRD